MQFTTITEFLSYAQAELIANRLMLPTLPDIAVKVRDVVASNQSTAGQLAEIISTDPALSARLIQVANSPLYRSQLEISSIQMVITRLGNSTIRTLVTSLMMQQMWSSNSAYLQQLLRPVWSQGVSVAATSRALSIYTPHLNRDEAMLAGLIHQIGKLPIITLAEKIPQFRDNPESLAQLLDKAHAPMAKLIMETWNFPKELKEVSYEYINFQRNDKGIADYTDVVQIAFILNSQNNHNINIPEPWQKIPAFIKLGLPDDLENLASAEFCSEIHETESLFN